MEVIIERGCGIDVHKKSLTACIMGNEIKKEIRTYGTFTKDLKELKCWLQENGITHVAIESTGVYWKPVFNVLEDSFEIVLANSRHIKNVPGRKTDPNDSSWICKLLRAGLIRGSFIPPKEIRELKSLTRYRKKLLDTIGAEKNRIDKILEESNIKISSVASDSFGVSGTQMIEELIKGELTVGEMAELSKGRLRKKREDLKYALAGEIKKHHKIMLKEILGHIKYMEKKVEKLEKEINKRLKNYKEEYEQLQTIPGVKEHGAASIIAEIGIDMDKFPTEKYLSSWVGMSPGNNESAGKKKVGRQRMGINI